ncbi:uroporphyrinogen decarboxylase [Oxyplasma meridianum]|uniref:Uroporphyrinogen decarboxylase n=1 Tax=Oxyplasma meridianum TaxID=3073602 RepID=A0AAX4NF46_9ARCH
MSDFINALNGEYHSRIPVWFMRQAGRYMRGYSEFRKSKSIKELCMNPEIIREITYEPVRELGVDSAIIFFDIMLPAEALGFRVDFRENHGPVIENSIASDPSMKKLHDFNISDFYYPLEASIRNFREKHSNVPIIGFAGGPLTIASYLMAGSSDRDLLFLKKTLGSDTSSFRRIMEMVTEMVIQVSKIQIRAGSAAIQIFDSWSGNLSPNTFSQFVKPYLDEIVSDLSGLVPLIYFSTSTAGLLKNIYDLGFDFLSLDWRMDLREVMERYGTKKGIQGNLDPSLAERFPEQAFKEAMMIAKDMRDFDRYIFNLGHGVLPGTDVKTLKKIVEIVHGVER